MTRYVPEPVADLVSPQARTVVYIASLVLNIVAGVAVVVALTLDVNPARALAVFGAVMWGIGTLNTALATGYRPTRPDLAGDGDA